MYFQVSDLKELTSEKKIFFTAICVERVVQVFEFNYDNTILEPRNIVEDMINSIVIDKINISEINKHKKTMKNLIPDVDEMGSEFTPSMEAGVAILYLLNAIISKEEEDIINALVYSLEAVDSFSEYNQLGLEEEKEWHKRLLDIVKNSKTYPIERVREMNEEYPQWSEMWRD